MLQEIEYPLVHVLSNVEMNGAKVDKMKLANHSKELSKKIEDLSSQAFKIAGEEFNLDSPKQLLVVLYEKLKLPILKKTPKGQPSTNEETLQRLAEEYEIPKIILQYRTLAKLKSTYTDSLIRIENSYQLEEYIHLISKQSLQQEGFLLQSQTFKTYPLKQQKVEELERHLFLKKVMY